MRRPAGRNTIKNNSMKKTSTKTNNNDSKNATVRTIIIMMFMNSGITWYTVHYLHHAPQNNIINSMEWMRRLPGKRVAYLARILCFIIVFINLYTTPRVAFHNML